MPVSIFSLPRELRDQIYEYHLSATYNHCLLKASESQTSPTTSEISHPETLQQPRYGRLEILLVSKSVHEEATLILYKCGIFVFNVPPAIISLRIGHLNTANLQNVIILVDLINVSTAHSEIEAIKRTKDNATALIEHFAQLNTTLPRATCEVQIGCHFWSDFEVEQSKALIDAIGGLTRFSTVTVKIPYLTERMRSWYGGWLEARLEEMGTYLKGSLGKQAIRSDDEFWYCWRFIPGMGA